MRKLGDLKCSPKLSQIKDYEVLCQNKHLERCKNRQNYRNLNFDLCPLGNQSTFIRTFFIHKIFL